MARIVNVGRIQYSAVADSLGIEGNIGVPGPARPAYGPAAPRTPGRVPKTPRWSQVSARMYLRCTCCGAGCRAWPWKRMDALSACARITSETGHGPTRNRHPSRTRRAESVLIPLELQAADLQKLPLPLVSSRSLRGRRRSSGCWSGGRSPGWTSG